MDVNWTYCGDHFYMYTNIKSLYCTLATNIMLYINYLSLCLSLYRERQWHLVWTRHCLSFWTQHGEKDWILALMEAAIQLQSFFQCRVNYQILLGSVEERFFASALFGKVICIICSRLLCWLCQWFRWSPFINFLKQYTIAIIGTWHHWSSS